jgi:integrase
VCEGAGFNARRDMAIVRLAVDTGLRRAELAGIGLEDLDLEGQVVRVVGKGRRVRTVPFGTKAAVAIDRYMRVRSSHCDAARPELWLGLWGPVRPNGLAKLDRLSRSLLDFSALMEQSRRRGWALVALEIDVFASNSSTADLMRSFTVRR